MSRAEPEWLERARREGRVTERYTDTVGVAGPTGFLIDEPAKSKPLVEPSVAWSADGSRLVITVPVETKSESNQRDWRARSKRSNAAWKAVSRTVGPHVGLLAPFAKAYHHDDRQLVVTFTRLGGRRMDRSNLAHAMKGCEDAIAFFLGADDGDPRWSARFEQDPASECVGVRIEMEVS